MRSRPRVSVRGRSRWRSSPAVRRRGAGLALLGLVAISLIAAALAGPAAGIAVGCAGALALFARSLPGAAPDGVLIGFGVPLVSMIGWHHPGHRTGTAIVSVVLATVVIFRVRAWRPRQRGYAALGAFWLSVPVAACAAVAALVGAGG